MLANSGHIWDLWAEGGPFIGSTGKPHVRITVERNWVLGAHNAQVGTFKKPPLRWVQRADQSQVETEIPNVMDMTITESIDQDAATLSFNILNQKLNALNVAPIDMGRFGNPGYYSFSRGASSTATSLWGQTQNEWYDVLVPNALLRTYEGYGGTEKTIAQALADGNIVQTGVWLVDEVVPATGGGMQLTCRNLGKLLIDQPLYPPMVPMWDVNGCDVYPLRYARYFHIHGTQTEIIPYGRGGVYGDTGRFIRGIEFAPDVSPCRPNMEGYWLPGSDGGVFTYGYIDFYGSLSGVPLNQPIIGMTATADNNGYWLAARDGGIYAFGSAQFFGSLPSLGVTASDIVAIERSRPGNGYILAGSNGGVYCIGDAAFHGSGQGVVSGTVVGFDVRHTGGTGYWLCTNTGHVYAFGAAGHFGGINGAHNDVVGFASTPSDNGYYLVRANGTVYAYGDAVYRGGVTGALNDPITDIAVHPDGNGYWLAAEDGGVFTFGPGMDFWGSLPGPWVNLGLIDGNYADYTSIIKDLLLWSGFWLNDGGVSPEPHGNLEMTGIYNNTQDGALPKELFDKKPSIDVINELKLVVGYIFWIDNEGAAHFESPNWWTLGNFLPNGTHTTTLPTLHEAENLSQYQLTYSGSPMRSRIVIASEQPDQAVPGSTVITEYTPQGAAALRGLNVPLIWSNKLFIKPEEQQVMAELVDLHINMQRRIGSSTCPANPLVQINDQVQIVERETSEAYVHYVRSITRTWDRKTGRYQMTLNTNWLGDEAEWAIVIPDLNHHRTASDDLGVTDPYTVTGGGGVGTQRTFTDRIDTTDSRTVESGALPISRSFTDALGIADDGSSSDIAETQGESLGIPSSTSSTVGAVGSTSKTVTDAQGLQDSLTAERSAAYDPIGITDSATAQLNGAAPITKTVPDNVGIQDTVTGELTGSRDPINLTDSVVVT